MTAVLDRPEAVSERPDRRPAWAIAGLLAGGTIAGYLGFGVLVSLAVPMAAIGLALLWYRRRPTAYVALAWWSWLLIPEIRRIVDWKAAWNSSDPIMLTAPLVTFVGAATVFRHAPELPRRALRPFMLAICGVFVAYIVGFARAGVASATYGLFDWACPVLLATYLAVEAARTPALATTVRRLLAPSIVILGAYGAFQWAVAPAWDKAWILEADINTVGFPHPEQIRSWGTLNSSQPYACVLATLILIAAALRIRWRFPVYLVGILGLALSLVRSAWLGLALAMLLGLALPRLQWRMTPRKAFAFVALMLALVLALTLSPGAIRSVSKRLDSFAHLGKDQSFHDRLEFYRSSATDSVLQPLGHGIGSTGTATKLSTTNGLLGANGNFDSGLMEIPFVLGWLGTLLYMGGVIGMSRQPFRGRRTEYDLAASAAILGGVGQLLGSNVLTGVIGVFILFPVGLAAGLRNARGA